MNGLKRTILHADLDAFFASVEQREDPSLRGRPVLVGGSVRRGVVAAASYEARRFGVHSAMPMAQAVRLCPQAIVVRHNFDRYVEVSKRFFAILEAFSPIVESLSLDEGFLDITGTNRLFGDGLAVATAIKRRVQGELGLVASVGVAPTKFVAKIASDIDKPDGLRVVSEDGLRAFLGPLPISRLWGVGSTMQEKLLALGLQTIGDVARYPSDVLERRFGAFGNHISALSQGVDPRLVERRQRPVSIGHEDTFPEDVSEKTVIVDILRMQADRVAARLRRLQLRARMVMIKVKFADFRLATKRRVLADTTNDGWILGQQAVQLFQQIEMNDSHGGRGRIRLCGVSAGKLASQSAPRQLCFHEANRARGERLAGALDAISDRFGSKSITRAIALKGRGDGVKL